MTWYVPPHVPQMDGTPCAAANCWAAVGAWLADAATGGTVKLDPADFRKRAGGGSGSRGPSGCRSGFESDLVKGLDALGITSTLLRLDVSDAREVLETTRRAVFGIAIDYEVLPIADRCQESFEGNHMLGVIGGRPASVMDPLCDDLKPLSLGKLMGAAEKFAIDHGRGPTIQLVRVRRPIPASLPSDKARIAALEGEVADLQDALRQSLGLGVRVIDNAKDALR